MIPKETPYKILKYIVQISRVKFLPLKHGKTDLIRYLFERGYISTSKENSNKVYKNLTFKPFFDREIYPIYEKLEFFIEQYEIEYIEQFYTIAEIEKLIEIRNDKSEIITQEYTFQTILSEYFGSSKHRKLDSNLSKAIKKILKVELFPEESKDLQYLSILYPINNTKYIILCENHNRLIFPRHSFIEFWYAGGKNTKQLKYIPKPKYPIFYLCDWDFDGLGTYAVIKKEYFPKIKLFIPKNFMKLKEKQHIVKEHRSLWKNKNCFRHLTKMELEIVEILYNLKSIIEEQKIKIDKESLIKNEIY